MAEGTLRALRLLLQSSHVSEPGDLPALIAAAGKEVGAAHTTLYVVDYDQVVLVPLIQPGADIDAVTIEGTLAGRCFAEVTQQAATGGDGSSLWTPLLDGTERLGVMQTEYDDGTEIDDAMRAACLDVASLAAEIITSRSRYGDFIESARRRESMAVRAELQWRLLPPLTFVSPRVAVAGVLSPTHEVAGDCFDYSLNGDTLSAAVFDAMGHGLEAALLASVAVSALRNARRTGCDLTDSVRAIDAQLSAQFGPDKFVTGIVGELDVATGWWRWVTCGHPPALVIRGGKVVKTLEWAASPPMGLGLLGDVAIGQERLEPGDRLLIYTDGVVEARDAAGEFFGVERLVEFVAREASARRPAAETMRRLNLAILSHQEGALQDDATTLMVEWMTDQPELSTP